MNEVVCVSTERMTDIPLLFRYRISQRIIRMDIRETVYFIILIAQKTVRMFS